MIKDSFQKSNLGYDVNKTFSVNKRNKVKNYDHAKLRIGTADAFIANE
jgi:hypothetical protein